jgi:hypothetical protein
LYDLPLELLDIILQKSYLCMVLFSSTKPRDEEEVIKSLRSVDVLFGQRITRQRFKKTISRQLKNTNFYEENKKCSAKICRNNSDYFLTNIQPNDQFINALAQLSCITKEESELIQRQSSTQDKSAQLLRIAQTFDDVKYSNFAKCLRQTSQMHVAKIDKIDGVVRSISINFGQRIEMPGDEYVYGVSKLRNRIYVLSQPSFDASKVIRVFENRNPFRLQKEIEIEHLRCPVDIVSCEQQNCLYVSDYGLKYVWKITREKDGRHNIVKFILTGNEPFTLSVSSGDGHLLKVSAIWSILNRYGTDAKLISSIQLPNGIKYPRHVVEKSTGNLIILHWYLEKNGEGWSSRGHWKWVVSELTRDGQTVIRRFIPSNKTQQLNVPDYIFLNSDDQVFVADTGNDRVILLDSELNWDRILCSMNEETKTRKPYRLCYDEENKRLIIVGCSSSAVNSSAVNSSAVNSSAVSSSAVIFSAVNVYSVSRSACRTLSCPVPSQTVNMDSKTLNTIITHQQIRTNEPRSEKHPRFEIIRLIP